MLIIFYNKILQRTTYKRIILALIFVILISIAAISINMHLIPAILVFFLFNFISIFIILMIYLKIRIYFINRKISIPHFRSEDMFYGMGLNDAVIQELLSHKNNEEVLIAEYDQDNKIFSYIGDIPLFSKFIVTQNEFKSRSTNRVSIVLFKGEVLIKKKYASPRMFFSELFVLYFLRNVKDTPDLKKFNLYNLVTYQTFVPGKNLGSELTRYGISVSDQYQLDVNYNKLKSGNPFNQEINYASFKILMANVIKHDFIPDLYLLLNDIHEKGVIINDLKFGNILTFGDKPFLIDFDRSDICFPKTKKLYYKISEEVKKIDFLFSSFENPESRIYERDANHGGG
ncbi:BUD32 family EKC/KEOPS complex subunit [Desulfosarcina alkanivorans]|nr:hypothetical protein [Desulfosarcina alkanivorans]